jgi:hypothetical protein
MGIEAIQIQINHPANAEVMLSAFWTDGLCAM